MVDLGSNYSPLLINDVSQVVGIAGPAHETSTYISSGGTGAWVNIGSLGGTETQPAGVNNLGEIVGFSATSATGPYHAFLYAGGKMIDLGTLGGDTGYALGVNDAGVVVGYSELPGDSVSHAFIYYGSGAIQDLNDLIDPTLGWTITGGEAINDAGQIAADGYRQGGYSHALLLMPTPEPSSLCLLCAAILGFITIHAGAKLRR